MGINNIGTAINPMIGTGKRALDNTMAHAIARRRMEVTANTPNRVASPQITAGIARVLARKHRFRQVSSGGSIFMSTNAKAGVLSHTRPTIS